MAASLPRRSTIPPPHAAAFYHEPGEGYFFYPSRINASKRQHLAVQGFAQVAGSTRLVICGESEDDLYYQNLQREVSRLGLTDRVTFLGRITEPEKLRLYARSLAVIYPPFDEDYGYITLEAMLSGKPVLTCTDSGGPLEFVVDGVTGAVTAPDATAIGAALAAFAADPARAAALGPGRARRLPGAQHHLGHRGLHPAGLNHENRVVLSAAAGAHRHRQLHPASVAGTTRPLRGPRFFTEKPGGFLEPATGHTYPTNLGAVPAALVPELNHVDLPIYHLGNNPVFFSHTWFLGQHKPGIVVLHDLKLHNFFEGINRPESTGAIRPLISASCGATTATLGYEAGVAYWRQEVSIDFMAEHFPMTPWAVRGALAPRGSHGPRLGGPPPSY